MKYIPKEERKKTKQSVKTVFSNNFYMLKLIFSASPSFVLPTIERIFPVNTFGRFIMKLYNKRTEC